MIVQSPELLAITEGLTWHCGSPRSVEFRGTCVQEKKRKAGNTPGPSCVAGVDRNQPTTAHQIGIARGETNQPTLIGTMHLVSEKVKRYIMPLINEKVIAIPERVIAIEPEKMLSIFLDSRRESCAKHYKWKLAECASLMGMDLTRFIRELVADPDSIVLPLRKSMLESGLTVATRAKLFVVLQTFCRQMLFAGYMRRIPAIPVERIPKRWMDKFEIITAEDIATLEKWVSQLPKHESLIGKAILGLLYYRGLRLSEVVSLRLGDIDLVAGTLNVLEKGGETRSLIPINETVIEMIRPLYNCVNKMVGNNVPNQALLVSPTAMLPTVGGKEIPGMNGEWIKHWVRTKVCGILNKKLSAHSFRRSAITALVDMDTPVMAAAAFARHSSAYMLEVYYQKKEESALRCQSNLDELHHGTDEGEDD